MHINGYRTVFLSQILACALLCFISLTNYGQDAQFSLQDKSPMLINPAHTGEVGKYRANLNYRSQWNSLGTPFTTVAASFDLLANGGQSDNNKGKGRMGAGFNFLTDKSGPSGYKVTSLMGSVAYHFNVNKNSTVGGGMNVGVEQRSINPADGKWASRWNGYEYDPSAISGESFTADGESSLGLGAGIVYHYKKESGKRKWKIGREISAGLAGYNLGRIKLSESQTLSEELNTRYSAFTRIQIPVAARMALEPMAFVHLQGAQSLMLFGGNVKYVINPGDSFISKDKPMFVSGGAMLRLRDALVINTTLKWSDYSVAIAYDVNYGGLNEYSSGRGAFELALGWQL